MGRPGDVNRDVASALDGLGFTRRVTVVVASFVAAASVAARTDHVAWLPSHAARPFAELLGLRALRTVLPPLELGLSLVWHARSHSDAGSAFFRALVTDVLRERKGAHGA